MPTRSIGAGDIDLTRAASRGIAVNDVSVALHAAIDAGVGLVESGDHEALRLIGDAVRTLRARDRVTVACRLPGGRAPLQHQVEACLRAVRLDALPLALVPVRAAWRTASEWPELAGTCARLIREGKVVQWGASLDAIEDDTQALLDDSWLTALRVAFSLCERAAEALIAAAIAKSVAVLAARPLAGGALAGALGPGVQLPPTDDRRAIDPRALETIAVGVAKLAAYVKREPTAARSCDASRAQLERNPKIADLECETVAELALRFVVDRGAIALPRLHRREHVAMAIAAAAAPAMRIELPALDT